MRAKTINEYQDFERGRGPKESMGIGVFPKNPIPKFMEEVESLLRVPERIAFSEFNKIANSMREEFIIMSLRDALIKEYGLPVEVDMSDFNPKVIMKLSNEYNIIFTV